MTKRRFFETEIRAIVYGTISSDESMTSTPNTVSTPNENNIPVEPRLPDEEVSDLFCIQSHWSLDRLPDIIMGNNEQNEKFYYSAADLHKTLAGLYIWDEGIRQGKIINKRKTGGFASPLTDNEVDNIKTNALNHFANHLAYNNWGTSWQR